MDKLTKIITAGIIACGLSYSSVAAPILSFNNEAAAVEQNYYLGDNISLELWISGLDSSDLGGFDIGFVFDHAITSFQSVLFNDDWLDFGYSLGGAGTLNLASLSSQFDLSTQADALHLATLNFSADAVGSSMIAFSDVLLSDGFGFELSAQHFAATLNVSAQPDGNPVPEPGTIALLLLGALAVRMKTNR
ncbi:PEP-CTERM sorting domain-containing protein [Lacimicrobium alkaliphilum]|uniref:Ice-binding protein C-terminal domain-containing protein n=1 Tax=Lacimicrobium alkaliphilum TaxID=1526571 RepID=A0A0U2RLB7_9ALTE|nr:PEP-CTERM sorting domain-containing protein [Lacimicrobium alkaliphilum]ALS98090.1 hypothetical protein AT746_07305 [Lacimicrobium alkaliphilum]